MLAAGASLFSERGWVGTTLAAVAAEAGTAVETVYSAFGSKSGLLMAAMDLAVIGDDGEEAMVEREEFLAIGSGRRSDRLRTAACVATASYVRSIPVLRALEEAAASDEAAAARLARYEEDRHHVIAAGLELILGRPAPDMVVDAVWSLASPESLRKLTEERHWSIEEYEHWLAHIVGAAITAPAR